MVLVVVVDEVLDDGARFPEDDSGVGVFDGGNPPVGVDRDEGLCLYLGVSNPYLALLLVHKNS